MHHPILIFQQSADMTNLEASKSSSLHICICSCERMNYVKYTQWFCQRKEKILKMSSSYYLSPECMQFREIHHAVYLRVLEHFDAALTS